MSFGQTLLLFAIGALLCMVFGDNFDGESL
jgi:hypothetical protein